ncbi:MAG TPA: hypothetical protein VMF09_02385 [Solirubrobacteraceae bacterium]|nr:hypothetical protein [Solirubrobacteraceae bacterium]
MSGERVLEALAARPGGRQLLALCEGREDVALVGGAVRDLLLGREPRELDVVLAGEAGSLAGQLAGALGGTVRAHERFGTALVEWREGGVGRRRRIDIAARRAESYPAPGALPQVREGSLEQDLARRDFTVNAIAVVLGGPSRGALHGAKHAVDDLAAGRLRALYERSFVDDPTRLWRLARYQARLAFDVEPHTAELAAAAVAAATPASVSRARIGSELRLALGEADAPGALDAIERWGLLRALHPQLRFDAALARAALALLGAADGDGDPDAEPDGASRSPRAQLLLLAALLASILGAGDVEVEVAGGVYTLLNDLEFPAGDRDLAMRAASGARAGAERLARALAPSQIYAAVERMSPEGVALAGAWGQTRDRAPRASAAAGEWLSRLCGVGLLITGEDLLAAGVPEGPEIRRRLESALLRKLDGELDGDGREAELSAALESAR